MEGEICFALSLDTNVLWESLLLLGHLRHFLMNALLQSSE